MRKSNILGSSSVSLSSSFSSEATAINSGISSTLLFFEAFSFLFSESAPKIYNKKVKKSEYIKSLGSEKKATVFPRINKLSLDLLGMDTLFKF